MNQSYIFILCPPFSGSTILWKLVSSSESVSALPKEGQFLPETKGLMRAQAWNKDIELPWGEIKQIWHTYWDQEKSLFLEKSPPNLMRTDRILEHFSPAYFLIMVRNPYALCEGLIRRVKQNPKKAARFVIRCLRQQAENTKALQNSLAFSYEEFSDHTDMVIKKIQDFIPQIGEMDREQEFGVNSIEGIKHRGIKNLNQKKIDSLSPKHFDSINQVFKKNIDVLNYWGYEIIEPPKSHVITFYITKLGLLTKRISNKFKW